MPVYIMFGRLTNEGRATIKNHAERIKEVDKEIEKMEVLYVPPVYSNLT